MIGGQTTLRHKHDPVQRAVSGVGGLGVGRKMGGILHIAHHRESLGGQPVGVIRHGQGGAQLDGVGVAEDMDHAFVGSFGHPAVSEDQPAQVVGSVGFWVCRKLLKPHHSGVAAVGPLRLGVQILHRLDGLHAFGGTDGVDVLRRQPQRGEHPEVKDILLDVVPLGGTAHIGGNADQAGQHHHTQQDDAKEGDDPAHAAFHLPDDIFTITFPHCNHHSICSTGMGWALT